MAITSAEQRGNVVFVYGERGKVLYTRPGTLLGYTGSSVTIANSTGVYAQTYNEKGSVMYTRSIRKQFSVSNTQTRQQCRVFVLIAKEK